MKTQYTQGKFEIRPAIQNDEGFWVVEIRFIPKGSSQINSFHHGEVWGETKEEAEANGKLYMAAPDLLGALEACRNELNRIREEMIKPQEKRDSFWIRAFFSAPMCGVDCMSLADKAMNKATK